jgi:hypothetical protein
MCGRGRSGGCSVRRRVAWPRSLRCGWRRMKGTTSLETGPSRCARCLPLRCVAPPLRLALDNPLNSLRRSTQVVAEREGYEVRLYDTHLFIRTPYEGRTQGLSTLATYLDGGNTLGVTVSPEPNQPHTGWRFSTGPVHACAASVRRAQTSLWRAQGLDSWVTDGEHAGARVAAGADGVHAHGHWAEQDHASAGAQARPGRAAAAHQRRRGVERKPCRADAFVTQDYQYNPSECHRLPRAPRSTSELRGGSNNGGNLSSHIIILRGMHGRWRAAR